MEEEKLDVTTATPTAPVQDVEGTEAVEEAMAELSGRDRLLSRFREAHADFEGDPTDDDLYSYADGAFVERDDYKGRYDELNGANERLAEVIRQEPSVAKFIGMIANGSNPMYAIGKSFGDIIDTLDDDSLEELERGMEENRKYADTIRKNFETYVNTLKEYLSENNLNEEEGRRINDTLLDIVEALAMGNIDKEVIDLVYKGIDYDANKESEIEAAKLAGKNEAINAVKDKRGGVARGNTVPDVGARKTAPPAMNRFPETPKRTSLADAVRNAEPVNRDKF